MKKKDDTRKISLTFADRITINSLLSQKAGNMIQMLLIKSILSKTDPTPVEIKLAGVNPMPDGRITFNANAVKQKEVYFEDAEISILKETVETLDKESRITVETFPLCEKIKNI